ncbi:cytochrome b [Azospirillum sp.]|uniref:cytochrome b n=1 Tax=Azospirillum sp. TaxID=34012 RepID=UPI003D714A3B
MRIDNAPASRASYDAVSIAFHWITFLLVLAIFVLALFPGIVKGSIALHKSLGLLLLAVVPLRLAWRLTLGRKPAHDTGDPAILRLAASGAHVALYALLIVTPLLGWLFADTKGMELKFFGADIPALALYDRAFAWMVYAWKQWIAYGLLALIFAHAAAAIGYHAVIRKDGVLRSMMPHRATPSVPA